MSDSWSEIVSARLFGWTAAGVVVLWAVLVLPLFLFEHGASDDRGARVGGAVFATVVLAATTVLLVGFTRILVRVDGNGLTVTLPRLFGMRG